MNMLEELKLKGNPLSKLPEQINKAGDILAQIKQLEKAQLEDKTELKCELPGYITPFKIFTVPLADLMENEYKLLPDNPIPRIVRRAFAHILTYGMLDKMLTACCNWVLTAAQVLDRKESFAWPARTRRWTR